jgi:hypothetical protein
MTEQSFDDFMTSYYMQLRVAVLNDQRPGQFFFNHLFCQRPDISEQIHGQYQVDPFYRDDYLAAAIKRTKELW